MGISVRVLLEMLNWDGKTHSEGGVPIPWAGILSIKRRE